MGAKKSVGWLKHNNFSFYKFGDGIFSNKTPTDNRKTSLTGLPRADGIILNDVIFEYGVNAVTEEINPAVFNERRPDLVQPNLDPFARTTR